MSKQKIQAVRRDAIWNGYDKKCLYCGRPLSYTEVNIDHFIPESISADKLDSLKAKGILPHCYSVHGDYNLVVACSEHNTKKGSTVFDDLAIPTYLTHMRTGVRKARRYLIDKKYKDKAGNAIRTLHILKERGKYTEDELVAAIRARDYSEPIMRFLGVEIPSTTTRITIDPALEEFFKDGTISYYDIFTAIVNDTPKRGVSLAELPNNAVMINDDAVLRYGVKSGVVNIKKYNRILD